MKAAGKFNDYWVEYDGGYAWSAFPQDGNVELKFVSGSPFSKENPHYMRVVTGENNVGFSNKAYDGICLKKDMEYEIMFFARCVKYDGSFSVSVEKEGKCYALIVVEASQGTDETYNRFKKYKTTIKAEDDVKDAKFVICLTSSGIVEFDFISMFPKDAVAGIFRKDLFEKLQALHPRFIRFPGGCIIEGNTLENRYRYKDSLKEVWNRKNNWNRWAVHNTSKEKDYTTEYSHYNQTLGLGYYEYFLLCELIGAKPLPVLNVGFACQYQSEEMVAVDTPEFKQFVQDAIDLIEFANGSANTKWGAVRKAMGHEKPFHLSMIGIGNEQWQTENADFFERYTIFEKAIHEVDPNIKLIGSAGPDITSDKYRQAWKFYHENEEQVNFVYAVDEHYYVKPEWLYENVNFYDNYSRKVKVFSGEYAAHPISGATRPNANNLQGALAEAAFLTGLERNADVVLLASYAPLFARMGYTQWAPDMIWFDGSSSFPTPSYYVQKMYSDNMGSVTLATDGLEKEAAKDKLYYSLSYDEKTGEIIIKVVNAKSQAQNIHLMLSKEWEEKTIVRATILTGEVENEFNCLDHPDRITPYEINTVITEPIAMPALSFAVIRIS
jgi:alpha-L-arabinofuranosidase